MKVILDYSIFFHQKYGGISRYFLNLHDKFLEKNIETKIIAPIHNNIFLKNCKFNYFNGYYIKDYPRFTRKIFKEYNHLSSKMISKLIKPDIIHKTFYEKNIDNSKSVKKIITVYDLAHEIYYKEYNKQENYRPKKKYLNDIDYIICPSNKTKSDLINFYNIPKNKIEVVYMGIHKFNQKTYTNRINIDKHFILYVGDRKRYKNFLNLIKAYSLSTRLQKDFILVCCGGGEITENERKKISDLKIDSSKILQIDGNDNDLCHLYKNASAFIFPSKYEGLGLPPLEAMSLGCPVISSNHEAIIEAVGDAASLFNPDEPEDIKLKIEDVLYSTELTNQLKNKGIKRSDFFSWEKCAKETLDVYKKVSN